jgi:RNAse (barnase) inhibitor barstar
MANLSDKFYLIFNEPPFIYMGHLEASNLIYSLQCEPQGGAIKTIRGDKCVTVSDLHNEIAAALQFPGYYGENWNALDECLRDLEWLPASWYLIHLCRPEAVLPNDDDNFRIFMTVLLDASRTWANPSYSGMSADCPVRPFNIIISGDELDIARAKTTVENLLNNEV